MKPESNASRSASPAFSRRVLLCAIGMSPQIVTETLYALAVKPPAGQAPWVPTEIHVITTAKGADNAKLNLLSTRPGMFHRLRRDYGLPPIAFDASHFHVIGSPNGAPLDDIRTPQDNEAAADLIAELVRDLTADANSELHASLAGGRKTMSYYLGYAMSLFGRAQDKLSHVLVSEGFENHPDFYYPTPYEHVIHSRAPAPPMALNCALAQVQLAQIPFVRLRDGLPERLLAGRANFTATVAAANRALQPAQMLIDLSRRQMQVNGQPIPLSPTAFALYAWLAQRAQSDEPEVEWTSVADAEDFLRFLFRHFGEFDKITAAAEEALRASMLQADGKALAEYFAPLVSRGIKQPLIDALGAPLARRVLIQNVGNRRTGSRYRLPEDLELEVRGPTNPRPDNLSMPGPLAASS